MTDIVERLTYRAENLWSIVRPHAAILDLEAAAYIRQLEALVEDAFIEGYCRGSAYGDFAKSEAEDKFEAWSKEREKDHSTFTRMG